MSTRKPYNDRAGYVASLRRGPDTASGRGWVVLYDGEKAGLCTEGGRWSVVCETHCTLVTHTSQRDARASMKGGSVGWCDCCRGTCTEWTYGEPCQECGATDATTEGAS